MSINATEGLLRRLPVFEIPKFEYETVLVDLQHIVDDDVSKAAKQAEDAVNTCISIQQYKFKSKGKSIIMHFPNMHPRIRLCFLTFVLLNTDKLKEGMKLKIEKPPT